MYLPRLVILLLVFNSTHLFARTETVWGRDTSKKDKTPYLDTNYVVRYKDRLVISGYQSTRNYLLDLASNFVLDTLGSQLINYRTNSNLGTGIGVDYDKISFSLGRATPVTENDELSRGKTSTTNLAFSLNGKKHRIETYYRSYRGFYDANYSKYGIQANDSLVLYYKDPSLQVTEARGKFFWYFNKKRRFSYAAAYSNTQRQLKSAGSFFVIANLYGLVIDSDTNLIPLPSRNSFPQFSNLHRIRSIGFSFAPGFSYNLVLIKRIFANGTISWGPEIQFKKTSDRDLGENKFTNFGLSSFEARISGGYNGKYLYVYWFLMGDINSLKITEGSITKNLMYQGGVIGYRFRFNNKFTKWLQGNKIYQWI